MSSVSKVSTAFLFDSATERMSALQKRLATAQAQMSEGKQVLSPSDAPDKAAAIQRLNGEIDRQNSNVNLLNSALNHYKAEETALSSANDILTRLKELAVQAANDTLGNSERNAIATEMQALRNELVSVGNARDDTGNYLFSGSRVQTPAFGEAGSGAVTYQGDQTQISIPAGVERTVKYTRSGTDVYQRVVRSDGSAVGFFDAIDREINAVKAGRSSDIRLGISDIDQMAENLTLAIARSGSDQQVVQSQLDTLTETKLRLQSTLSDIQDLDYTEAVTRMNKDMMALQAAMGSFSKISGLNLFDYIRN
ncbi:MAG: Flagellar hook-associated protein 3 [Pseudomonadota bacterium]|jgi:flagellar hook-associated protein 3 FlgL